jgi:ATP-binding cassette subfamily C (CFTR/MRP) protein 10
MSLTINHFLIQVYEEYDLAMVGDRGVSLSGGQRARIALARAMYQNLDMYLLDEPFAALDVHVADHVHDRVVCKMMSGRTRIVGTHLHQYLRDADLIVELNEGQVVAVGKPDQLLHLNVESTGDLPTSADHERSKNEFESSTNPELNKSGEVQDEQFAEERGVGYVPLSVYFKYGKSVGLWLCLLIGISFVTMQTTRSFSDVWLSIWVNALIEPNTDATYYVRILAIVVGINSLLAVVRAFSYAYGGIVAAERWHQKLLHSVLKTRLRFFDQRPFGQLINRFSSDIYQVDEQLPFTLNLFLTLFVSLVASVAVATSSIWPLLFVFVVLVFPYLRIQRIYRAASSDLKRICSTTLSPMYSVLSETLNGLTSIRCFRAEKRYVWFVVETSLTFF